MIDKETKMELTIMLTVTEMCNLSCVYCYEHNKSARKMSFRTAKKIIDDNFAKLGAYDRLNIRFFGGEPFLAFDLIKDVVKYVEGKHWPASYSFFAATNVTLIHREIQKWLRDHPNFSVGLSLDGPRNMHNLNRSNSFDLIDLSFFKENYSPFGIKLTISKLTLPMLADGIIECHKMGFDISCNLAYGVEWDTNDYCLLKEELGKLIGYYLNNPNVKPCSMLNLNIWLVAYDTPHTEKWCGAGTTMFTYAVNGIRYPCHYFMPITNKRGSQEEIDKLIFTEEIPSEVLDKKCQVCIARNICPSCYGSNFVSHGNMYHKDDMFCQFAKLIFYANAYFTVKRWESGQMTDISGSKITAMLVGAKRIIEWFKNDEEEN